MLLSNTSSASEWKLINDRNIKNLIAAEFLHDLYNQAHFLISPTHFRHTACIVEGGKLLAYAPKLEWDVLAKTLGEKLLADENLRNRFREYLKRPQDELLGLIDKLKTKYEKDGNAKSSDLFYDLYQLQYTALDNIYAINLVQFEHAINYALTKNPDFSINKALPVQELSVAGKEELKLLRLSVKVSKKEMSIEEAEKNYNAEFEGAHNAYGADAADVKTFQNKMAELLPLSLTERARRISAVKSRVKKKQNAFEEETLQDVANLGNELAFRRDRNKKLMGQVSFAREQIIQAIAESKNVPAEDIKYYFLKDFQNLVENGVLLSEEDIQKRKQRFVIERNEGTVYGSKAIHLSEQIIPKVKIASGKTVLDGEVASEGVINGYVRRVYNAKDAAAMKGNEILVAYGTDFDLMEGLQKCIGIITEEGGIMSHASLVAREMGKPCLIAVTNAMNILNNGDFIEIDTQKKKVSVLENKIEDIKNKEFVQYMETCTLDGDVKTKAGRLKELRTQGIPTLPGVVAKLSSEISMLDMAEDIARAFRNPEMFASSLIVRSNTKSEDGKNASNAGKYDSHVCHNNAQSILNASNLVAGSYKRHMEKVDGQTILVQPYYKQMFGGVAFSHNPLTGEKELTIESSEFGASFVVEGNKGKKVPQNIANELSAVMKKIDGIYNYPVDVEWGYGADGLKIFQVRPIVFKTRENSKDIVIVAGGKGERMQEIFNHAYTIPYTKHFMPLPLPGGSLLGALVKNAQDNFDNVFISCSQENGQFLEMSFAEQQKVKVEYDTKMIGPLFPIFEKLLNSKKRTFGICGDVCSLFKWQDMEEFHSKHDNPVSILVSESFPAKKAATFALDKNGTVLNFLRKEMSTEKDIINIGGYILDPNHALLNDIIKELIATGNCKEDIFFKMCAQNRILSAYHTNKFSCNVNSPTTYLKLIQELMRIRGS
jgi:phosphohistidine swiveling domain-containing protein/molybdopterin-guanine dinucleotide biosynthesis protein A